MRNIELRIGREPHRDEGIAAMALYEDGARLCALDIQYSLLRELRNANPIALDFLVLASAVYALDKTTGKEVGTVEIPSKTSAVPMTFLHQGKQYIVFATGNGTNTALIALTLPAAGSDK